MKQEWEYRSKKYMICLEILKSYIVRINQDKRMSKLYKVQILPNNVHMWIRDFGKIISPYNPKIKTSDRGVNFVCCHVKIYKRKFLSKTRVISIWKFEMTSKTQLCHFFTKPNKYDNECNITSIFFFLLKIYNKENMNMLHLYKSKQQTSIFFN